MPADQAQKVIELAASQGVKAWVGGHIEKRSYEKKVIIAPKGIEYPAETLAIRME